MNVRNFVNCLPSFRCFSNVNRKCDYFITTPIFYVNASPHIGHLYTALLADASHRFKILLGNHPTIFSTGTDEHGIKIQQAAQSNNIELKSYCDKIYLEFSQLFKLCEINFTRFIRTTDEEHMLAVQHFWKGLINKGHIYPGSYKGWYCDADESFLTENQLITVVKDGKETRVSSESGRPVNWVEEENFKFILPEFKDKVVNWIKVDRSIRPKIFQELLLTWVEMGLMTKDVSVSRPKSRVHWGIPVPDCAEQTIYVWLDALVNYLTVTGYPKAHHWPPDIQVIGKDILKFHGIYWPAFLFAAGLEPPRRLMVHSHWTVDGEKMSKSKGNVVSPFNRIQSYSSSGLRYFLLREATPHSDSNYSDEKVQRVLNSELADTLGNLLSRCCGGKVNKKQIFPPFIQEDYDLYCKESSSDLVVAINRLQDEVGHQYMVFNFYKGIATIIAALHEVNKFFEESKPWVLSKGKKESDERHLNCVLHLTMEALRICGIGLQPIVPSLAESLLNKLSVHKRERTWNHMTPSWDVQPQISLDVPLDSEKIVLFNRLIDLPSFPMADEKI